MKQTPAFMTAATLASAKAHEDMSPSCIPEAAIGATLARTDTWTGVFELRIDGIPLLIITVILTVAITYPGLHLLFSATSTGTRS